VTVEQVHPHPQRTVAWRFSPPPSGIKADWPVLRPRAVHVGSWLPSKGIRRSRATPAALEQQLYRLSHAAACRGPARVQPNRLKVGCTAPWPRGLPYRRFTRPIEGPVRRPRSDPGCQARRWAPSSRIVPSTAESGVPLGAGPRQVAGRPSTAFSVSACEGLNRSRGIRSISAGASLAAPPGKGTGSGVRRSYRRNASGSATAEGQARQICGALLRPLQRRCRRFSPLGKTRPARVTPP